jgi:cell division septal protein FtsQ
MKNNQFEVFKFFIPLISCGIGLILILSSYNWASYTKNIQFSRIEITGNKLVPLEEYENLVLPFHGNSIFSIELSEITRTMERHTNVLSAKVSRKLPNGICIEIIERNPIAMVNSKPPLLLDKQGVLFPLRGNFADYSVPVLSHFTPVRNNSTILSQTQSKSIDSAKKILQYLLDENKSLYNNISEVRLNTDDDFELILFEQPTKIVLGKQHLTERIKILIKFNEQLQIYRKRITDFKNLDFRFNRQIIAREWV